MSIQVSPVFTFYDNDKLEWFYYVNANNQFHGKAVHFDTDGKTLLAVLNYDNGSLHGEQMTFKDKRIDSHTFYIADELYRKVSDLSDSDKQSLVEMLGVTFETFSAFYDGNFDCHS